MNILRLLLLRKRSNLLINRDFGLLWIGQAISISGDLFFDTTLILWITTVLARGLVWTALAVSGVALASTIPQLVVGPLVGVFVDRWDKRRTMLLMDGIRAVLILLLLFATGLLPLPLGLNGQLSIFWKFVSIYSAVVLETCCAQFFNPSRMALIGDIVPDPERTRAMSMINIALNFALILAPMLAAPLFLAYGATWAIVIDALSFVVSFLFIAQIHVPTEHRTVPKGQRHYWREFGAGLRFFRGNRVLVVLLVAGIIFNFGTGIFNALYLLFVLNYTHAPVNLSGLFAACYGAAVIVGSMISVTLAKRIGEGRLFWSSLLSWGILCLFFARMASFGPALIFGILLGLANSGINVVVGPLLIRFTERKYRGRVSAIFQPTIQAAQFLAITIAGFLASTLLANFHARFLGMVFGSIDSIFMGVGLLAIIAGIYALFAWRGLGLHADNATFASSDRM